MKALKHLLFGLICLVYTSGYSQETATVYFIRSTGMVGFAQAYMAFIDGQLTCKLNNNRFSIHQVQPGEHTITVQFYGKKAKPSAEPIQIVMEPGNTYYVQMVYTQSFMSDNLYCQEVTENSAKKILRNCVQDTKCQ